MDNRRFVAAGAAVSAIALAALFLYGPGMREPSNGPSRRVADAAQRPWFHKKGRPVLPPAFAAPAPAGVTAREPGLAYEAVTMEPVVAEVRLLRADHVVEAVWTDEEGRFLFPPVAAAGRMRIAARAEGFATAVVEVGGLTEILVALDRSARIRGHVLDGAGSAVEGAWVVASDTSRARWPLPQSSRVTTAADGSFELVDVPPGRLLVEAGAPGFSTVEKELASVGAGRTVEKLELRLAPAAVVRGRVTHRGEPVAGAEVGLRRFADPHPMHAVTDAEGRFAFENADPGRLFLVARHPEKGIAATERTLAATESSDVELALESGMTLAGTVLDPDGRPVAGAELVVARSQQRTSLPGALGEVDPQAFDALVFVRLVTDAEGRFSTPALASATASVRIASRNGFRPVHLQDVPLPEDDLVVRLERGARIAGRIRAADGAAWRGNGGTVQAILVGGYTNATATPEDGRFVVDGLGEGEWDVSFRHPLDGESDTVRIRATEGRDASVTLSLSEGATVEGRVVSRGKPVAGARVGPGDKRHSSVSLASDRAVRTRPDGRFSLPLSPGLRSLVVYHPEYRGWMREDLSIPPGETVPIGDVELLPGVGSPDVPRRAKAGLFLVRRGGDLEVTYVLPNSGAARVGIAAEDLLLAVDGKPTADVPAKEVESWLEGEPYSRVVLSIRQGGREPVELEVERIPELTTIRMLENGGFSIGSTVPAPD